MLLASAADFEPATPAERAAALYWEPSAGVGYREYPFFQQRIDKLIGRAAPNNQKTIICGCGWGYLVAKAVAAGYDAYGGDASSYAISKAQALFPALASRFVVADLTTTAGVNAVRSAAGLVGQQRFALGVTEDLLTVLTDTEISNCLSAVRNRVNSNLLHIVTLLDPESPFQDPRLNWKTAAQWLALLSPPDVVMNERLEQL